MKLCEATLKLYEATYETTRSYKLCSLYAHSTLCSLYALSSMLSLCSLYALSSMLSLCSLYALSMFFFKKRTPNKSQNGLT